jgi:erythromycin esterase-like protein/predicted phosphoribosyltransferase
MPQDVLPQERFRDRTEAGSLLAAKLAAYADRPEVIVLGLPRGGVPVANEVAHALNAPLDVFVVRKLGVPGYEELAMGAIASGGVRVLNQSLIKALGLPDYVIDSVTEPERRELERRERVYRAGRPPPDVRGRTVILVDDGLATGATMQAAVEALRQLGPARIIVAVPVGSPDVCGALREKADEVVCGVTPDPLHAVGYWYRDFSQTSDEEVRALLAQSRLPAQRQAQPSPSEDSLTELVRDLARPLTDSAQDWDPLMARIGEARFVLLGEASHGTHEFYRERARITQHLIEHKGFTAVAVEADWPDAYRVNCYVRGASNDVDAKEALADFRRFPTWMWRNTDVVDFVEWMRGHNDSLPKGAARPGFYGLDLYSLHESMKAVLHYLDKVDPEAAKKARARFACFDQVGQDLQVYGFLAGTDLDKSCADEVLAQLVELRRRAGVYASAGGGAAEDEFFYAEQNALLVKNAEEYYRAMFLDQVSSWNLRDRHMAETLDRLAAHLDRRGVPAKIVVWAHNSHVGDARATEIGRRGELNLGQLARERHGGDAVLVGFTTHQGTVTAASEWGGPAERKRVRPALEGSYELLFHRARPDRFLLTWPSPESKGGDHKAEGLRAPRLERAIGVIYRPETERMSHYFHTQLPDQFDAVLHFDETRAVEPLESTAEWEAGEVPETYPFAV